MENGWQNSYTSEADRKREQMIVKDNGGGDFQRPEDGTHLARSVRLIDLGTQRGEYQGQETVKRQLVIMWELPGELIQTGDYAGQPFLCSKFYTASLNEKATLRHDLENWRGKAFTQDELNGFNLLNILDKPCMVTLTTNDKGKQRVTGVTSVPKGMDVPAAVNPIVNFSLDQYDGEIFDGLSDGFKKIIVQSPEYAAVGNSDGIPF
jgi:hypothetical protein